MMVQILSDIVSSKIKISISLIQTQQFKFYMSQHLKDWSSIAIVIYNQWKKKQISQQLRAPQFEQLKYSTSTFDQVKKLQDQNKNWTDQCKSIRKKLYYYLMAQSLLSFPNDYKKQFQKVRSNIDTASSLLKNIKRLQHMQQAIKICEKPPYVLFQREKKRVKKLTLDNKQLFQSYCQQFFVYAEFLRLHILQILSNEKEMRQLTQKNKSQQLRVAKDQHQSSTEGMPYNQIKNDNELQMKDQQQGQQEQQGQQGLLNSQTQTVKDWFELQCEKWLKESLCYPIREIDFQEI